MKPLEYLYWHTGGEDSNICHRTVRYPARDELARLRKLEACCVALNEIVEGVRNERWASEGRRLKDTPEWCAFYCAVKDAENQPDHTTFQKP